MSIVVDIKAFATQVNELSCEMFDRVTKQGVIFGQLVVHQELKKKKGTMRRTNEES